MKALLLAVLALLSFQVYALSLPLGIEKRGFGGKSGSKSGSGKSSSLSGSGSSVGGKSGSGSSSSSLSGSKSGSTSRSKEGSGRDSKWSWRGKAKSKSKGYGKEKRPDFSKNDPEDLPPPYSSGDNAPPPPYHPGTYGQKGPKRSYWNGQYYPYKSYGYGDSVSAGALGAFAPFFFAGPFGFYGPYGRKGQNSTTESLYIGGVPKNRTRWVEHRSYFLFFFHSSSTYELVTDEVLDGGTYLRLRWDKGQYFVDQYDNAKVIPGTTLNNISISALGVNNSMVTVNSTLLDYSSKKTWKVDPDKASNGTIFLDNKGSHADPRSTWISAVFVATAFGIATFL